MKPAFLKLRRAERRTIKAEDAVKVWKKVALCLVKQAKKDLKEKEMKKRDALNVWLLACEEQQKMIQEYEELEDARVLLSSHGP